MSRRITPATSLDTLKKEARRLLKAIRAGDGAALERIARAHPAAPAAPGLRDVQHALAREHGYASWAALKTVLASRDRDAGTSDLSTLTVEQLDRLANDLVTAFDAQDASALARVNAQYNRQFTFDDLGAELWRRLYSFRQRASGSAEKAHLRPDEARLLIAQDAGFGSWKALTEPGARRVPPYAIDTAENRIAPRRQLTGREWDELIAVMQERRITGLDAQGLMTDAVLARVASLAHVTSLSVEGSRLLTDDGLRHLGRMAQLEELNLSGAKVTDSGLEVLRQLPSLRSIQMTWQRGISDAGVAHLRACERLEKVNLMGSPTGDGAIAALQGKPRLRAFSSGRLVTDAGLRLLHGLPLFRTWGDAGTSGDGERTGARLLIDGPFTDAGLAGLAGLDGVGELDLFWHVTGITPDAFAHFAGLANLQALGADGDLTNDVSMRHIAAFPRLRSLRAQGSAATDTGFEALSRSTTLERFWGREAPHLTGRGFVALSTMPALKALGVSLANVDDAALSTLADFPSLQELTPIDVQDDGFRHVGRCRRLVRLTCMYCRETTDVATAHIVGLPLTHYYAGLTRITDRSLELLGRMSSLEQVELYECKGVTDAGLPFLAALPRLREVHLDGLPGVTLEGTKVFASHVRVKYST